MMRVREQADALLGTSIAGFRLTTIVDCDVLYGLYDAERDGEVASIFVMHRKLSPLPGFSKGFVRAAWLTKTISHGSVPRLITVGETDDGAPYSLFQHLAGESLAKYLSRRRGTVPPGEALRLAGDLSDALAVAHQHRVVHGGVQPGSVLLGEDGTVFLLNLGWTPLREQAALHYGYALVPGSAAYLSPEQARGDAPGEADDLWSVAAILYELLSGCQLREGPTEDEVAARAAVEPAPSLVEGAMAPLELVELLEAALRREPADRLTDAREFSVACKRLAADPVVGTLMNLTGARSAPYPRVSSSRRPSGETRKPSDSLVTRFDIAADAVTGTHSERPSEPVRPSHPGAGPSDAGVYSNRGTHRVESIRPRGRR